MRVTTTPAIKTPSKADKNAFQGFIPITAATSEPVQAPVTGRGIAINKQRPQNEYFSIFALFFSTFARRKLANLLKNLN